MKLINWFKKLRRIVNQYDKDLAWLLSEVRETQQIIKDRTDIHADVHYKAENQIIVVGRYRGRDYIQTFSVHQDSFTGLVEQLRDMQKYGVVRRLDAPPQMKAVVERELHF